LFRSERNEAVAFCPATFIPDQSDIGDFTEFGESLLDIIFPGFAGDPADENLEFVVGN
jgi:hypothetical protein